jgi:hypothetical protein
MEEKKPEKPDLPPPPKIDAKQKLGIMFLPTCIGMAGFFVFIFSAPFWATDVKEAKLVLIANGYKPITVGGFDPFGCGLDLYATKYTAFNPKGVKVKGNVCKTPRINPPTVEETGPVN